MITPSPLTPGDVIAILTPSTVVRQHYVEGACEYLARCGFTPRVMPHICYGDNGALAGTIQARAADLNNAIADPEVKAIWCARGGYGAVELLEHIDRNTLKANPKWLIGFSDISALHAVWHTVGIQSLHATMLRRLAVSDPHANPCVTEALRLLTEERPRINYCFASHPFNRLGQAHGEIIGGNLAVLSDLAATPYDLLALSLKKDTILFFEDVAETISRLQRRLWRLYLSGILSNAKAIIFGQFTAYEPNADYQTMEDMISARLQDWQIDCPVVFGFPTGHVPDKNYPIIVGQNVTLTVTPKQISLSTI